jgi:homoserine O-succinyltransferase
MPLTMHEGRIPDGWGGGTSPPAQRYGSPSSSLRIALVNNMPDPAFEDTGRQFFTLLNAAAGDHKVSLQLFSLPQIVRGERVLDHFKASYSDIRDLFNGQFDGVVITGTEPLKRNLREEAYWGVLTELFDWAERNTASAVLSCLAAHASVLHSDGIERCPLPDKQFGVFEFPTSDHALMRQIAGTVRFPHSRWNEVRGADLIANGYSVLTYSPEGGVDCFVKRKKQSLFVHFQGHPEYDTQTLLKEYRRDIKRFLRAERETYPNMPRGYFDAKVTQLLVDFREKALCNQNEDFFVQFPDAAVTNSPTNTWHASAISIYSNWLHLISTRKDERSAFTPQLARSMAVPAHNEIA